MVFLTYCKAIILHQRFVFIIYFCNINSKFSNFYIAKHQLLAITLDNASNNDTFVRKLSAKLREEANIDWNFEDFRFRCFSHILNLAAQAALDKIKNEIDKVNIYFYTYILLSLLFLLYINNFIASRTSFSNSYFTSAF
jgi:hypothetical protein